MSDSQQEVIDRMDAVELSETLEDAYEHDNIANLPLSDWFYKLLREFYDQKHAGKSMPFGCFGDYWTDESRTQRLTGDQVVEIFKRPRQGGVEIFKRKD